MVKDAKSIARALRCSASTKEVVCLKDECPWFYRCSKAEIEAWEEEHPDFKGLKDDFKADFYSGCDCDQICKDAADFIENSERADTAAVHQYNLKDSVAWWECESCGNGFMIYDDDRHNYCSKCGRAIKEWKKVEEVEDVKDVKDIDELGFDVKTRNTLVRAGLRTDEDVREAIRNNSILKVRGLGRKMLVGIMEKVKVE